MAKPNPTTTVDEALSVRLDSFHAGAIYPDREDQRELGMEAWSERDNNACYHRVPVQGAGYEAGVERATITVTELFGNVTLAEFQWVPDKWDATKQYPRLVCFRLFGNDAEAAEGMLRDIVLAVRAVAAADQSERSQTRPSDDRRSDLAAKYG